MKRRLDIAIELALLLLMITGIYLRFYHTNWSQGANLHPDEYGLTNTLTQLSIPKSISDYFNTRLSPMSSYSRYDINGQKKGDGPDNGMRWGEWPMIIIRFTAEQVKQTGYDELRLVGRSLSAFFDSLSVIFIFLIGARLYSRKIGLLAAALSSLAVMQIQQSHFMTVDNFAVFFTMVSLYACVRIAQRPPVTRTQLANPGAPASLYILDWRTLGWYILFGVTFGMTLASKINLLPLGGLVLVGGFIGIADLKLKYRQDITRIALVWAGFTAAAVLVAAFTFRVTQPMSFRNTTGDTTLFSFHINPDWWDNMQRAQTESNGIGGGPPGDQWAHRTIILFPWINMVLWGLGLPLGLMSWAAFLWAAWRVIRYGDEWRAHLIPLVWTGGFFIFMATRWVMSIRYFLPIYPFMALFAAWALERLWHRLAVRQKQAVDIQMKNPELALGSRLLPASLPALLTLVVLGGTLAWALAFSQAVYGNDHTRIQATRWIFQNIPSPFHLAIQSSDGKIIYLPVSAPNGLRVLGGQPYIQPFNVQTSGRLTEVILPHLAARGGSGTLNIAIALDPQGKTVVDQTSVAANGSELPGPEAHAKFHDVELMGGSAYYLVASVPDSSMVTVSRSVIANESWDEGLPFPFDSIDPFGQLYKGAAMENRWYDNEQKRQMFIQVIDQSDYIILPSQRGIWTTCRIPRTYPMTMAYYRALFAGQLGFDLVAQFQAPIQIGPLEVSDVAGTAAWGHTPQLPLFLNSQLAAEEAFSVYDHPPVWIFKKRADFNPQAVADFFGSIDLSQVVVEAPRDASLPPCQ